MNRFSLETANSVVALLYDSGARGRGLDELSSAAGVSRADLASALGALEARGHRLERSPARGVRLVRPTVIDAHLVERGLPVEQIGRHVICFGEVGSTNDVAFDIARQDGPAAVVVTAEHQRAGRGRLGRSWLSPPGSAVLASVLLQGSVSLPHEELTLAAGLAVAEGIEQAAGVAATLAWPNDVLIDEAKVSGVMVEVRGGRTVVGFGINVHGAPSPEQLGRPATCLSAETPAPMERIEVLRHVLGRLDRWVADLSAGAADRLHERWLARCRMRNRRIRFQWAGQVFAARVLDLSPLRGLVVETDDGRQVHLPAGQTSVLGPAGGGRVRRAQPDTLCDDDRAGP